MKNNDFDYIKERFDNSGVTSPESINEELILEKLDGMNPVTEVPKKSKKKLFAGISAAAAVAVIAACAITFTSILNNPFPGGGMVLFKETAGLRGFSNRDEIKNTMNQVLKINNTGYPYSYYEKGMAGLDSYSEEINSYSDSMTGSSGSGSSGNSSSGSSGGSALSKSIYGSDLGHNATYVQSVGVDEADTIKTDGKYIYYLSDGYSKNAIEIFTAQGDNSKKVTSLSESDGDGTGIVQDFYIHGNRLITLSYTYFTDGYYDKFKNSFSNDDYPLHLNYVSMTSVTIYDISDVKKIKKLDNFCQSGQYISSRMIGGMLYLVTDHFFYSDDDMPYIIHEKGATKDSASLKTVPVENVFSVETPVNNCFMVVSAFNTDKITQDVKVKAIIGSADTIYCNQENLFVTAYEYTPIVYQNMLDYAVDEAYDKGETLPNTNVLTFGDPLINDKSDKEDEVITDSYIDYSPQETQIIKISLDKDISFVASNKVEGVINNQYSLDEYNGNLRVATTSYNEEYNDINNLFILDKNLKQLGEVSGFAENETIQAVRYIGETAYVITYEQTDPLFVIDVADPKNPKISGEVKISGYSTMLVPVDENTLLGIGYHTEDEAPFNMELNDALKLVTFDVTDKNAPKVIDTKIFANTSSVVQYNPKALVVNNERGDYTIPTNYFNYNDIIDYESESTDAYTDSYVYKEPEVKNGLINFRIDNGKIKIIDNYTSDVFTGEYDNADRCVYVGDYQYILGERCKLDKHGDDYYDYTTAIDAVKYK